ncbi:thermonuclease family protein [Candidatus Daviesbacteria bacterium]|nr:thermonuclease family protein [Candidatus Daviesbacteria bacterium]
MFSNTKFLTFTSILIITLGFGLLWFSQLSFQPQGLNSFEPQDLASNSPRPSVEATSSSALGIEGEKALVTQVVDGDTIKVNGEKTVRLIGIDTPETVDPRRPVGCFGKEASNETKSLLTGKVVYLQKDVSETDKYGRLLRLVFLSLEDGSLLFVNDYLVREGFAKVYTYPPDVKYNEQFLQAEKEARQFKKGLWGRC